MDSKQKLELTGGLGAELSKLQQSELARARGELTGGWELEVNRAHYEALDRAKGSFDEGQLRSILEPDLRTLVGEQAARSFDAAISADASHQRWSVGSEYDPAEQLRSLRESTLTDSMDRASRGSVAYFARLASHHPANPLYEASSANKAALDIKAAAGVLDPTEYERQSRAQTDLAGSVYVDPEEQERLGAEQRLNEQFQESMKLQGFQQRQQQEFQDRENAKLEFARRSAEASEEVLAEERRKRQAAELAAKQAEVEKGIADKRADRAERRETRMVRLAIIGLFGTVASLALAAWPFL